MTNDTQLRRPLLRGDLLGPAVLVVAGAAAALAGAPAALAAPLSLAASAATAERVARHRRRGPADLVLVAIAAAVGMATLLGFALNALPSGLTAASWAVGTLCLELGALACCARRPSPPSLVALLRAGARPTPLGIACGVVGVAVLAATIGMSAVTALDTAPAPSAISIVSSAGGTALVRVDAGAAAGSYALEVVTDRSRQTVVARLDLPADGSTVATVPIPPGARSTVELRSATSMAVLRRLILDRTAPASSPKNTLMTAILPQDPSLAAAPPAVNGRLPEQRGRHPQTPPSRSRPLRVLNVVHRFLPELGGTENHVAEVTSRLATRPDMDVVVLTTDRSGLMRVAEVVNGVPVVRKTGWPRSRDYYFSPGMLTGIRRGGWDVIHFQGVHTLVPLLGMAAARQAGIPYLLTLHSGGATSSGREALRGPQFRALTPLLRGAARLVAVSRFERQRFAAATGIPAERFTVINNGGVLPSVPDGTVRVPGRILTIGRLERYKGHHRAIEALPIIRAEMPGAELVVLGAGPYEERLRETARRCGVDDALTIRHIPPADRSAMSAALGSASVMAALSSYEANPVSVLEAASVGLPVVGLDVAGTADLVEDGLVDGVAAAATPAEIAEALLRHLRGEGAAPRMPVPTWDGCAEQIAALYLQVAAERPVAAEVHRR